MGLQGPSWASCGLSGVLTMDTKNAKLEMDREYPSRDRFDIKLKRSRRRAARAEDRERAELRKRLDRLNLDRLRIRRKRDLL